MKAARCEVGSLDVNGDHCPDRVVGHAIDWGYPRGNELAVCSHHAFEAMSDGARVESALTGARLALDDDGDLIEVSS